MPNCKMMTKRNGSVRAGRASSTRNAEASPLAAAPSLVRSFARYVAANMAGAMALSVYILADTFFVANGVGYEGLAALNFALVIYTVMTACGLLVGIGGSTQFQIHRSLSQHDEANRVFTTSLLGALGISVLLLVGVECFAPVLAGALGAEGASQHLAVTYLRAVFAGAPLFLANACVLPFVRNDSNPRLAMTGMVAGSFLNIVLDWLFIFVFHWGMFGAAFATCFAPLCSLCVLSLHFIFRLNTFKLVRCRFSLRVFCRLARLGLSSYAVELSGSVVLLVLNLIILSFEGTVGVAAYGVVANFAFVATALFVGIGQGIQPLASSAFALGDASAMRRILALAAGLAMGVALVIYVGVFAFAEPLANAFNRSGTAQLTLLASEGMRLYFIGFFFAGANMVAAAFLSAVARPAAGMCITVARGFVLILGGIAVMAYLFGMMGVWLAFPVAEGLTLLLSCALLWRWWWQNTENRR